jgi:hypothetical protein
MSEKPLKVFLDANVIIRAGKPPGGPLMSRVEDLVKGSFITLLTTDLTKIEVAKKHAAQWLAYAHPCQRFAEALTGNRA